jgi:hypothetical protein
MLPVYHQVNSSKEFWKKSLNWLEIQTRIKMKPRDLKGVGEVGAELEVADIAVTLQLGSIFNTIKKWHC